MSKYRLRTTILELLLRVEEDSGYSHLLIDHEIKRNKIQQKDIGLLTEIVYGTIQRKLTLDYYLAPFLKRKVDPWIQILLRMSVYQMEFLDRVPDHATIHEAVEIAKLRGHQGIASLVNGVLRSIQRNGVPKTEEISDKIERLSIETSHPKWLVDRWIDQYGFSVTKDMCEANLEQKPMSVRIQPLKISKQDLSEKLTKEGFDFEPSIFSDQGIVINEGNIINSDLFKQGFLTIQDQSSMLATELLDVEPGMTVLDACSAPGGKVTHIAEKMEDKGTIHAYDLHKNKLRLINNKAADLNLSIINVRQADARNLDDIEELESFDRIMIDAPCSGLGVIRNKPDIKYSKKVDDINQLAAIQLDILNSVAPLLKKDGILIYSTCTVDKQENEEVVQEFLKNQPDYQLDPSFSNAIPNELKDIQGLSKYGLQLFPQDFQTNGFFIARFTKL